MDHIPTNHARQTYCTAHTQARVVMTRPTMRVDVRDLAFVSDWELWLFKQEWAHHRTEKDTHTCRQTF